MKYSNIISRKDGAKFERINNVIKNLDDKTALEVIDLYDEWEVGKAYVKDDRVRYEEVLYKVLQNHTSQADWTPDVAVSLFVRVSIEEWPEWTQPVGAQDSYSLGSKVSHNEKRWISNVDNNVWEPGVYGWDEAEGVEND